MAFHLVGESQLRLGMEHLGMRECKLGGYSCMVLPFVSRSAEPDEDDDVDDSKEIRVWTFVATPQNNLYLGPASLDDLTVQVVRCRGPSGTNAEYVLRMAEFIKRNIPEDDDDHLFELERRVKEKLKATTMPPGDLETGTERAAEPSEGNDDVGGRKLVAADATDRVRGIPLRKAS